MTRVAWRWLGAAVAGTSHARNATPCQDAFAHAQLPSGELIIGVADGAGSAAQAATGAQLLVAAVVAAASSSLAKYQPLSRRAWQVVITAAFATARASVLAYAVDNGQPTRDYAATLVLLILHGEGAACGLVGDCAAVILDEAGELVSLCAPQRGEYANSTNFVIQPDGLEQLTVTCWEREIRNAALFSDGLATLAMNIAENRPFRPFFEPLFAFLATSDNSDDKATTALAGFLDSARVNARTHDDKTLVLVQRLPS